jgi:hypothetical protein
MRHNNYPPSGRRVPAASRAPARTTSSSGSRSGWSEVVRRLPAVMLRTIPISNAQQGGLAVPTIPAASHHLRNCPSLHPHMAHWFGAHCNNYYYMAEMELHFDALLMSGVMELFDLACHGSENAFSAVFNPLHVVLKPDGTIRPIIDTSRSGESPQRAPASHVARDSHTRTPQRSRGTHVAPAHLPNAQMRKGVGRYQRGEGPTLRRWLSRDKTELGRFCHQDLPIGRPISFT